MMKIDRKKGEKGFSLIDVVITVAIIIVLVLVGAWTADGLVNQARQAVVEAAAQQTYDAANVHNTGVIEGKDAESAIKEYNESSDGVTVGLDGDNCIVAINDEYGNSASRGSGCSDDVGNNPDGPDGSGEECEEKAELPKDYRPTDPGSGYSGCEIPKIDRYGVQINFETEGDWSGEEYFNLEVDRYGTQYAQMTAFDFVGVNGTDQYRGNMKFDYRGFSGEDQIQVKIIFTNDDGTEKELAIDLKNHSTIGETNLTGGNDLRSTIVISISADGTMAVK